MKTIAKRIFYCWLKKYLILCIFILVFSSPSFPNFKIGVAYSLMPSALFVLNNTLVKTDIELANASGIGWQDNTGGEPIGVCNRFTLYSELLIFDSFSLCAKMSYVYSGAYKNIFRSNDSGEYYFFTSGYSTALIPIELGIIYNIKLPSGCISLDVNANLGLGLASAEKRMSGATNISGYEINNYTIPLWGLSAVAEAGTSLKYSITSSLSFDFDFGYMFVNIQHMKSSLDVPAAYIKKDDVLKDANGRDILTDYSNFYYGLKILLSL